MNVMTVITMTAILDTPTVVPLQMKCPNMNDA